jgi:hypothetical protein
MTDNKSDSYINTVSGELGNTGAGPRTRAAEAACHPSPSSGPRGRAATLARPSSMEPVHRQPRPGHREASRQGRRPWPPIAPCSKSDTTGSPTARYRCHDSALITADGRPPPGLQVIGRSNWRPGGCCHYEVQRLFSSLLAAAATSPPSGARLARGRLDRRHGLVRGRDLQRHLVHAQPGPVAGGDVVELAGQHDSGGFRSNPTAGNTSCGTAPLPRRTLRRFAARRQFRVWGHDLSCRHAGQCSLRCGAFLGPAARSASPDLTSSPATHPCCDPARSRVRGDVP